MSRIMSLLILLFNMLMKLVNHFRNCFINDMRLPSEYVIRRMIDEYDLGNFNATLKKCKCKMRRKKRNMYVPYKLNKL